MSSPTANGVEVGSPSAQSGASMHTAGDWASDSTEPWDDSNRSAHSQQSERPKRERGLGSPRIRKAIDDHKMRMRQDTPKERKSPSRQSSPKAKVMSPKRRTRKVQTKKSTPDTDVLEVDHPKADPVVDLQRRLSVLVESREDRRKMAAEVEV
jgi:hypothetical protein